MPYDIAFLHTAAVHEQTFSALLEELAPDLKASHNVCPDLLAVAQTGGITAELEARIVSEMCSAADGDVPVVVCTCSTIGAVAEVAGDGTSFRSLRIDRAMADEAVSNRRPVLVVAALESTLEPTTALLNSSAERLAVELDSSTLLSEGAWAFFEAGNVDAYLDAVETTVRANAMDYGVVVLAQASMAPVAGRCTDLAVPVLCSPRLGVEAAVAAARA